MNVDGRLLRDLRKKHPGAQVKDIALAAGIAASNISRVERGDQKATDKILGAYASVLGLSIDTLREQLQVVPPDTFRNYDALIAFATGGIWAEAESILQHPSEAQRRRFAAAESRGALGDLLCDFVLDRPPAKKSCSTDPADADLTLWFHSPLPVGHDPAKRTRLLHLMAQAMANDARLLYVSPLEVIDRLEATHFFLKLRLSIVAHWLEHKQRHVKSAAPFPAFRSRALATPPLVAKTTGTVDAVTPVAAVVPNELAYWREHKMFMAFPVRSLDHTEAGLVVDLTPESAATLRLHTHFLDMQNTDMKIFSRSTEHEFWELSQMLEESAGNIMMTQSFFYSATRPSHYFHSDGPWYQGLQHRLRADPTRVTRVLQARRRRALSFRKRLEHYEFRHIVDAKALEKWVLTGQRPDLDHRDRRKGRPTESPTERRARLQEIISLIDMCPNFKLALSNNYAREWTPGGAESSECHGLSWIVMQNDAVLLERQEKAHLDIGETRIAFENRSLADEWRKRFNHAWGRLRDGESDRHSVRERLMSWLDQVPTEY